jgi:DNA mismatch endonuclease (patch repair protein)
MRANVGHETHIERALRRALFATGLRYRKDARPVPWLRCSADIVFRSTRVCVFVDGCFWHGCPQHFTPPKLNHPWWVEKIGENVRRDRRQAMALRREGWLVLRVWEHDFSHLDALVSEIRASVLARKSRD